MEKDPRGGHNRGQKRPPVQTAKARVSMLKTGLRSKVAKHQREIENQVRKIREAEEDLARLLEAESKNDA